MGPPGFEPGTDRLWAGGSANWAMGPLRKMGATLEVVSIWYKKDGRHLQGDAHLNWIVNRLKNVNIYFKELNCQKILIRILDIC